ncbi:MAG: hypothetical protein JXP34_21615 [Planctomycetes bacterium]|nr:hypothetical protein [Planctomycetota bacterium]
MPSLPNDHPGGSRRDERGVVLLLVMLLVSILFVVVGQFAYSVFLDRALAENQLRDAQVRCDLASGAALFLAALGSGAEGKSISLPLRSGTLDVQWESESGKFCLQLLRQEDSRIATEQFERLFKLLEEDGSLTVLGLASSIIDFIHTAERPLLSLGELKHVDGITEEVLAGTDGKGGLSRFLTVHSDGRVNISEAPVQVIACLDESLNNEKTLALLKEKYADPESKVPDYVANLADRLRRSVTTDAEAYLGRISLGGQGGTRTVEVAARKEGEAYRMLLFNEIGENHEALRE